MKDPGPHPDHDFNPIPVRLCVPREGEGYGNRVTFNPNADVSDNRAQSRGRGRTAGAVAGGVGGLGVIIAIVFSLITGQQVDPSILSGGGGGGQIEASTSADETTCLTGADANANDDCRLEAATLALDDFWAANMTGYTPPTLVTYSGTTQSACGTASNQAGPFYCPADQQIYIDPAFFQIMRDQFGASAGHLAQIYVLGHEWGHHIQNIIGVMADHPNDGSGAESNSVRIELQADCFAGGWIQNMTKQTDDKGVAYFKKPTDQQLNDALNAAAAVGDDNIQSKSGHVNPDTWTHGSSEERQKWFWQGYTDGINTCDTFEGDL